MNADASLWQNGPRMYTKCNILNLHDISSLTLSALQSNNWREVQPQDLVMESYSTETDLLDQFAHAYPRSCLVSPICQHLTHILYSTFSQARSYMHIKKLKFYSDDHPASQSHSNLESRSDHSVMDILLCYPSLHCSCENLCSNYSIFLLMTRC